jgi:signal transduction histidine kinase
VEVIKTDGKKLHQILMHLLTNALKFTQAGQIDLKIERHLERGVGGVRVSVSDTGIGIPQGHRETIFEEFRQIDGSSTRQYGGTGLGLALCRKLAQSLGATIEVESALGEGSTFSLILPLRTPQLHPVEAPPVVAFQGSLS